MAASEALLKDYERWIFSGDCYFDEAMQVKNVFYLAEDGSIHLGLAEPK